MNTVTPHLPRPRGWRRLWACGLLLAAGLSSGWVGPATAAQTPACPPPAAEFAPAEIQQALAHAVDRGFLWHLRRDGREAWLYGTLHVAQRDWVMPGPALRQALARADQLALELDMTDPALMQRLQALMAPVPGRAPLPPALAQRLAQQVAALCAGPWLNSMRPEMQAVSLGTLVLRSDGLDPAYGIDAVLAGMARGLRKPVRSLETPQAQVQLMVGQTEAQAQRIVTESLDELDQGRVRQQALRLARAWAEGRLDELQSYPDWCDCLDTEVRREQMRQMLDVRNQAMAQQLDDWHRAGQQVLVAVGALHMIGPQGLPALLAARGFEVERVMPARQTAAAPARPPAAASAPAGAH